MADKLPPSAPGSSISVWKPLRGGTPKQIKYTLKYSVEESLGAPTGPDGV